MSKKIVNISPAKRVTEEALNELKAQVAALTVDYVTGFILAVDHNGSLETTLYSLSLDSIKALEIQLDDIARDLAYGTGIFVDVDE